jgi:starvation-inducible outer membrane lipoprotein
MEKVSPTFHFEAWRDASPTNEAGKSDAGITVQLGGRIVQAAEDGKGIVIVAAHLPIVNHPAYGPTDEFTRTGDHEFAFLYPGEIEPLDLMRGNRFIVVGTTTSRRPVLVNGIPKTEPFLIADCIHVWQTAGDEIADLKEIWVVASPPYRKRLTAYLRKVTKWIDGTLTVTAIADPSKTLSAAPATHAPR